MRAGGDEFMVIVNFWSVTVSQLSNTTEYRITVFDIYVGSSHLDVVGDGQKPAVYLELN